jgi:phosphoenolpyruvate carboxylase
MINSNYTNNTLEVFKNFVGIKFEMYNSLFGSLPFNKVEKTGVLLSLFLLHCEEGFQKNLSPTQIITNFLEHNTSYENEQQCLDLLFRFVQFAERQVVLFDALEDAAFSKVNDMQGIGTVKHLQSNVLATRTQAELAKKLEDFSVRLVLTAHPTQFYPGEVLGIIHDLAKALINDNTALVNSYLLQLGKTPFFKKEKPTPYDEALNLIWFLENVFYQAAGKILSNLNAQFPKAITEQSQIVRMGFWPGGDRDGNPFVKSDTTLKVAEALRQGIIKSYYLDVRKMKRRLTFKGIANILAEMESKLYKNLFIPGHIADISTEEILQNLSRIREKLLQYHNGLFLNLVDDLKHKVLLFGLHFASLDIRQDSSVHNGLLECVAEKTNILPDDYLQKTDEEKINLLLHIDQLIDESVFDDELYSDTVKTIRTIKQIQATNGELGCHRYIISHSTSALNIVEVYGMFLMCGWQKEELSVDIVPLFETIGDLKNAGGVMKELYENQVYRAHLERRGNSQTIMLGFSDGTKDGGYLMANWSIYKAKEELTAISRQYGIEVIFFDGRGGPPARGGGKTHQFYASMGKNIANKEIQLTIQGQTISSNFGTVDSAQFNLEQLLHAGISNSLFSMREQTLGQEQEELLQKMAQLSYEAYNSLKNHSEFIDYLNNISPLRYYAEANIGSRPSKRKSGKLNLNDLRAVPYVGAWSQLKQNLPGYYGVGMALEQLEKQGQWENVKDLYEHSLFFKTLLDNCEMAMSKCFFPATAYLADHPKYGELWNNMYNEFERTKKYILKLSNCSELMEEKPVDQLSIQMRQRIELPLVTIQQYALRKIRAMEEGQEDDALKSIYEKLVVRCSFGIINAERNSA